MTTPTTDSDGEIDKLLWELQLFTELHTPGMRILLDKERAKYVAKIQAYSTAQLHTAALKLKGEMPKKYEDNPVNDRFVEGYNMAVDNSVSAIDELLGESGGNSND